MKSIDRREFLKKSAIAGAGLLASMILPGCAGMKLEKKVKEISSHTMTVPNVYPAQLNQLFSDIKGVYGNEFVRELKQLPDMKEDYTPEKISALHDIYSTGKEIRDKNLTNAKRAVEDIIEAGEDTPKTNLISVPLREWYLMHLNKKWNSEDAVEALKDYEQEYLMHLKGKWNPKDAIEILNDYKNNCGEDYGEDIRTINFLSKTNWNNINNKDWKKWEQKGNEYVVLYKKNKDFLIQDNQAMRLRYISDKYDSAQTPEKTKKRGGGDCEDFAIEAAPDMEVLEKAGLYKNVKVVNFCNQERSRGHTVLTYKKKEEGRIFVMDNARRKGIRKFNSIIEAGKKIAKEGGYNAEKIWACNWRTLYSNLISNNFPEYESLI